MCKGGNPNTLKLNIGMIRLLHCACVGFKKNPLTQVLKPLQQRIHKLVAGWCVIGNELAQYSRLWNDFKSSALSYVCFTILFWFGAYRMKKKSFRLENSYGSCIHFTIMEKAVCI